MQLHARALYRKCLMHATSLTFCVQLRSVRSLAINYIIKGGGDSYERMAEVKATGAQLIVPLNFPKAYDVEDPYEALNVSFGQMKHWELAPSNPARLEKEGISFAFTLSGLNDKSAFLKHFA